MIEYYLFAHASRVRRFMPKGLKIVGYGRSKKSDEELRKKAGSNLDISDEEKEKFLETVRLFLLANRSHRRRCEPTSRARCGNHSVHN